MAKPLVLRGMPPVSPPHQPEPFAPCITLNLRDDVLPPGLVDVKEDANNEEDESYLQEILTITIAIYQCLICTDTPFPDHAKELEFVRIA